MNNFYKVLLVFFILLYSAVFAQSDFSVEAYNQFLQNNQDLTYQQLSQTNDAGLFKGQINKDLESVSYLDSISIKLNLTDDEKNLLQKNGFMVTERLNPHGFVYGYKEIYDMELPVFISTDAVLYAMHKSYDAILKHFEQTILIDKTKYILSQLHSRLSDLEAKYGNDSTMVRALKDLDIYITVPRRILGTAMQPYFTENREVVTELFDLINNQMPTEFNLFANTPRKIDFSQFKPRGHYTESEELKRYFKAMIWLGRIEIYLIAPKSDDLPFSIEDVQRQNLLAALLYEAGSQSDARSAWADIEDILQHFIGVSDNINLDQLEQAYSLFEMEDASVFTDTLKVTAFQDLLTEQFETSQRINSHILMSDPMKPDQIVPATAFLLFGQRFVIDSYVTGNVVYDRILFEGKKVRRMLPSSLDVLFALGNDAALQLIKDEMEEYPYGSNLAASRYLVDSYTETFWNSSLYNSWLQSIRTLAPPENREGLPAFMQTAAWWQQKMNTQLASWAQLRHDNLLYAKQSYSGGITCFFPEGFVEPFPKFYDAIAQYAENAKHISNYLPDHSRQSTFNYFERVASIMDTLRSISQKELDGIIPDEEEKLFLKRTLHYELMCGISFDGWFPKLFWDLEDEKSEERDIIVADVHTAPTDQFGAPVGWVMHAGTGPLNMAVIVTDRATGSDMAFAGPVMSYYEHVSTNFKRLTDEEWKELYNVEPSFRPDFVNSYLADENGKARSEGRTLLTSIQKNKQPLNVPETAILAKNYPNPFNSTTVIAFSVPKRLANKTIELAVYDVRGSLVETLLNEPLPAGNYVTRWEAGNTASGIYFYQINIAGVNKTGKMLLTK